MSSRTPLAGRSANSDRAPLRGIQAAAPSSRGRKKQHFYISLRSWEHAKKSLNEIRRQQRLATKAAISNEDNDEKKPIPEVMSQQYVPVIKKEWVESDLPPENLPEGVEIMDLLVSYRNPLAKIKKDTEFSYNFILDRLKGIGISKYPIDMDEASLNATFHRHYIHNLYGGNHQETFPVIDKAKVAIHGIDNLVFLSFDWNPHAPSSPGTPGLFFISGDANECEWTTGDYRVFVCMKGASSSWLYIGNYKFSPSQSLSIDEYVMQSDKVKKTWVANIHGRPWGAPVLQSIYERKLKRASGLEGTDKEKYGFLKDKVTLEDVEHAYASGEQVLGVYCMKCVGYEVEWKRFLMKHYSKWKHNYDAERARKKLEDEVKKLAGQKSMALKGPKGVGNSSKKKS